jgi:hypothetical protein
MENNENIKSPFLIYRNFLSEKICQSIIDNLAIRSDDTDHNNKAIKMEKYHEDSQKIIFDRLKNLIPDVEKYYEFEYAGTEKILFQKYPQDMAGIVSEDPFCANSKYTRKKWVKYKNVDITGVLWLNSYNNVVPIDRRTEVYGGKLEFPQYNFSLNPEAGTLILFPAYPHFIQAVSKVLVGSLYQARINMASKNMWFYDPTKFPAGDAGWQGWFKQYM